MMMRNAAKLIKTITILTLAAIWLLGCGSSDLLDENYQKYRISLEINEVAGNNPTLQIDVEQILDCDSDATTIDPEDWSDALGVVTLTVSEDAPGVTVENYVIEYIPRNSPDSVGNLVLPPDLTDPGAGAGEGFYSYSVPSSSEGEFTITLLSVDTKNEFVYRMGLDPATYGNLWVARYTIRVTFYLKDEYLQEREMTVERTVYLGWYDNC